MTQPIPPQQPLPAQPPLYVPRRHRGAAVLILGILSIVLFPCAGLVLGVIAWVLGSVDLRDMRSGLVDRAGEGLTRAGQVCGIIGTFLGAIPWFGFLLKLLFGCFLHVHHFGHARFM